MKRQMSYNQSGFTLIELLIVVAIIGILAAIAIPMFTNYRNSAYATSAAADLRNFRTAFEAYAAENGTFPDDSHIVLPNIELETVIGKANFEDTTPVGGNYNWEGPNSYPYAGVAILGATATVETMEKLDKKLDDGNLTTGSFRITPNGRHTHIFDE